MKENIDQMQLSVNAVLAQVLGRWRINKRPRLLSKLENYVYEIKRDEQPHILRVTKDSHAPLDRFRAVLDWIEFLASYRLRIPAPIRSDRGRLIETVSTDMRCFMQAFFRRRLASASIPKSTGMLNFTVTLGNSLDKCVPARSVIPPRREPFAEFPGSRTLCLSILSITCRRVIKSHGVSLRRSWSGRGVCQ
jgi:hypothetical protein